MLRMQIDLQRKLYLIVGLHESGKTTLAKHIASNFRPVIFDPLHEYDNTRFDVYRPKNREYPEVAEECEHFIKHIAKLGKYNLVHFSEASRIFPNKRPLLPEARNFFDAYRHTPFEMAVGLDCRRPAQLHTDLVETSKYMFIFSTKGVRDVDYLNCINREIGDLPFTIPAYHFIQINPDRTFHINAPVSLI